jgi:hypothetical protein
VRINQKALAVELGLSTRRIRQLVAARILPESDDNGLYDVDLCRARFELYSFGSDADWFRFYERTERDAATVDRLVKKATAPGADKAALGKAGAAMAALFDGLRFITACRSTSDSEREFVMGQWEREEASAFWPLVAAGQCSRRGKRGPVNRWKQ